MKQLTFGSLFAGIGGFDLGFERAGMRCEWQVEIDPYCQRVLAKHWPNVRRWDDVRTFPPKPTDAWRVDVVCGGFPCTDISSSGKCEGLDGKNSGLWFEMLRVIRQLRPRFVAVENVSDLAHRGIGDVLAGLAASGFDAEWECLPAAAFGLPQRRDRMFIVAHADSGGLPVGCEHNGQSKAYFSGQRQAGWNYSHGLAEAVHKAAQAASRVDGMDDGIPNRVDRIKCCGNAVVPQVAEWIGRRIVEATHTNQGA
jgi:DNA (cytosine-5)-methyltransferase 1